MTYVLVAIVLSQAMPDSRIDIIKQYYPSLLACMEAGFDMQTREFSRVRSWDCQRFNEGESSDD